MWGEWQLQGGEGKGVGQRWGSDECFEFVEAGALGFRLAGFLRHLKNWLLYLNVLRSFFGVLWQPARACGSVREQAGAGESGYE